MAPHRYDLGTARADVHFWNAPVARRTWRRYGFLWLVLLLAPFALAYGARIEGKDYVMKDGDVVEFRINV
ncbi:DUF933 domain-containing protein [Promicromonospora soli]|uniref:Uncharacterized protein n=1 Tax=Promicromonospora soli TaxID=2035533 RepID=A0A919KNG7_9MICO|nr:DUF933 domain-containing protein [Promicromonospora soli]GHH65387.1 hypothetical protein GCM10017772_03540 [Promicromonospora soli]